MVGTVISKNREENYIMIRYVKNNKVYVVKAYGKNILKVFSQGDKVEFEIENLRAINVKKVRRN